MSKPDPRAVAPIARGDPAEPDDNALIEACLEHDERAWEQLVRRYGALVHSMLRRHGHDAATTEDLFQDVFAILLRQLGGLRNRAGLPKWLMTTAHRVSLQRLKRDRGTRAPAPEIPAADAAPLDLAIRAEQREHLWRALEQLGGRCEELLIALYARPDRPSYPTIAGQLGMPVGSIGPTRARCLEKLLRLVEAAGGDTPP